MSYSRKECNIKISKILHNQNEENSQLESLEVLYLIASNISPLFDCGFFEPFVLL